MVDEKFESNRVLVESFKEGSAITEVWESKSPDGIRIFYDLRCSREFLSSGLRKRGPFIQQRDIPDLVVTIMKAQQFVSARHAEIRRARFAEEDRGLDEVSEGSYGEPEDKE